MHPVNHKLAISIKNTDDTDTKNPKVLTCPQCIRTAVKLSKATASLHDLGIALRKRKVRIENIQHRLNQESSQLTPLGTEPVRVRLINQNYIPQKIQTRKVISEMTCENRRCVSLTSALFFSSDFGRSTNNWFRPIRFLRLKSIHSTSGNNRGHHDSELIEDNEEYADADDSIPPNCEREQFAEYISSMIGDLSKDGAEKAMAAIRIFLENWAGFTEPP